MRAPLGSFDNALPAADRRDLLTAPVAAAVGAGWGGITPDQVLHVDTDPGIADTAAFVAHHGAGLLDHSANCVVLSGKRGADVTLAACVVLSHSRVDVNGVARKHLGLRKARFASMDTAVGETGMEYGGITPIGLPAGWRLLVDEGTTAIELAVIGSGVRGSKLFLPGLLLSELPGAEIVPDLAR